MNSFALCPLQSSYTPKLGNGLLEQQLLGGFARQRVQFVNNVHQAQVSVLLDTKVKQQYFYAFWHKHTQSAPQPFLWRLVFDDIDMTDYVCQFVADSLEIQERDGIVHRAAFVVRAKPNRTNQEFDNVVIELWTMTDGKIDLYFNLLEKLVNEDLPDATAGLA